MPEISRFLGIVITMYHHDHNFPHFHARYNEFKGVFSIDDIEMIEGRMPDRIINIVLEWTKLHQQELLNNWRLAQQQKPLNKIEPLV